MPNFFSTTDDILIAGFDKQAKDHDVTLDTQDMQTGKLET